MAQNDLGISKPVWSWRGFGEGAVAGAKMPFLQIARLFGSKGAAKSIQKLKQQGAYNSRDRWTNPLGKDVLQTSGATGNAGYAALLAAAGLAAGGAVSPTLAAAGRMSAGKAALAASKGTGKFWWNWVAKPTLMYEAPQAAVQTGMRYFNSDKPALAQALNSGNPNLLSDAKLLKRYKDILRQRNLGQFNPNDPQSVGRYRAAAQEQMDSYRNALKLSRTAVSVPMAAFAWRNAIKGPAAKGILGKALKYLWPVSMTAQAAGDALSKGEFSDRQMPYNLDKALTQDLSATARETAAQSSPIIAGMQKILPWPLNSIVPMPNEQLPANQMAVLKLLQKQGAMPPTFNTPQGAQTVKNLATDIDPTKDAYTKNRLIMSGVNRYANSTKGRQQARQKANQQIDMYRQLAVAKTPQQKQTILQKFRSADQSWTKKDTWGFSDANKQKIFMLQHMDKNPQLQKYVFQDVVNRQPEQLQQIMTGYKELWNDPQYQKIQQRMPLAIQKARQRQMDYIKGSVTQNFVSGLDKHKNNMKDLDNYLQRYYNLSMGGSLPPQAQKKVQQSLWSAVQKDPWSINKVFKWWAKSKGNKGLGDFFGNSGMFYGTVAAVALPATVGLMGSLFGGGRSVPQQEVPQQGFQPMAYAPQKNVTDRRLIVG